MKVRKVILISLSLLALLIVALILTAGIILSDFKNSGGLIMTAPSIRNKYFSVIVSEIYYPTSTVRLVLMPNVDVTKIPEYFPSLCVDFEWMDSTRDIYVFATKKDADKFDTYGYENIKTNKPIGKFVAKYSKDFNTIEFYPLVREERYTVSLPKDWCKR